MEYVGRTFSMGTTDCYGLARDYYLNEFGIDLPNFARPDDFWLHGWDMYMERYRKMSFFPTNDALRHGDVILMAVASTYANHCAIVMPDGRLLHHMYGRLSVIEPYKAMWRNMTTAYLRHPDVPAPEKTVEKVDLTELLSPHKRRQILEQTP